MHMYANIHSKITEESLLNSTQYIKKKLSRTNKTKRRNVIGKKIKPRSTNIQSISDDNMRFHSHQSNKNKLRFLQDDLEALVPSLGRRFREYHSLRCLNQGYDSVGFNRLLCRTTIHNAY